MQIVRRYSAHILIVLVVLVCASTVRIAHLGWGLPAVEEEALPSKVAIGMWGFDDGTPDLDPGTAGWPALSFYAQRLAQQVHYLIGRSSGQFADPLDYYVAWLVDPSAVILVGRATSVAAGIVVCLVAALLGFALAGAGGGLLAGLLCAFSPLLVEHSQLVEPDALVTLFTALATLALWRVAQRGLLRDYVLAGLWIGLGTGAKYTPAIYALSLWLVHLERRRTEGLDIRTLGLEDRRLGWAALLSFLAFCAASPYTLADLDVLRRDFAYQMLHMSSGHFGHEQQGIGYGHYLFRVLPRAVGWPALVAGIAGLALAFRDGPPKRAIVWSLLPFFLVMGGVSTHFDRYMLPAVLPLALGVAMLAVRLPAHGMPRAGAWAVALPLLLWMPGAGLVDYHRLQGSAGTQDLAADWIAAHMDAGTEVLATERYGPSLPYDQRELVRADPAFARMRPDQQQRLLDRPFYRMLHIPMYALRSQLAAYYYDLRNFLAYDWLVTSGAVRNRYLGEAERFPGQVEFYRALDELLEPAWSVRPQGSIRGPSIDVYRLDDSFRAAVRERYGPRDVDHFLEWASVVHAPHFAGFAQTIAEHAEFTHRWSEAAFWYEVIGMAALAPDLRALGYEKAGMARLELGELQRARELFAELRSFPARELVAIANLGWVAELEGETEIAASYYDQVLERDPKGQAGEWARRRLAALSAGNGP